MPSLRSAVFALVSAVALTSAANPTVTPFSPQQTAAFDSELVGFVTNWEEKNMALLEELETASGVNSAALQSLIAAATSVNLADLATITSVSVNSAALTAIPSSLRPALVSADEALGSGIISIAKEVASSHNAAPSAGSSNLKAAGAAIAAVGAAVAML